MFKQLLALFFCSVAYWLPAQDLLLRTTESLRNNVVRIAVNLANGSTQHGFGFITGEKNGVLYLATAAHVVHGQSFDQRPSQIQVWFYSDLLVYLATEVTFFEAYDLAILQLQKPPTVEYQRENWANFSPQNNQAVRFIGRERDWLIPAQGEIYKFDQERLYAYMPTVRPGTSGAPLVSEKGIVGLIIEDDNSEVMAVTLSKVQELFSRGGRFPYFNTEPIEKDLSAYHMVKIEGGSFEMGCKPERDGTCGSDEIHLHQVSISPFYLSKYEVTYQQFKVFVDATQYRTDAEKIEYIHMSRGKKTGLNWQQDVKGQLRGTAEYQHPVIHVSQNDAKAYCQWLSKQTGKTYRLPTEAEWEYAARGGKLSKACRYAGSNEAKDAAWYNSNSGNTTHPVGGLKANELELFDLSGNVWEWCSDWYNAAYYKDSPRINPQGPTSGTYAVLRGGSCYSSDDSCRLAYRYNSVPDDCHDLIGFRLARNL